MIEHRKGCTGNPCTCVQAIVQHCDEAMHLDPWQRAVLDALLREHLLGDTRTKIIYPRRKANAEYRLVRDEPQA